MRFVVTPSSYDAYDRVAYEAKSGTWHVLDAKNGFSVHWFRAPRAVPGATTVHFDVPRMAWLHGSYCEEVGAYHMFFEQHNSGYAEHLLTVSYSEADEAFVIRGTEAFAQYLNSDGCTSLI